MDPFFGVGILAFFLYFVLIFAVVAAWLQGLILACRANIILGIICFLLHAPLVLFGVIYWIFGYNIPQAIMDVLRK